MRTRDGSTKQQQFLFLKTKNKLVAQNIEVKEEGKKVTF